MLNGKQPAVDFINKMAAEMSKDRDSIANLYFDIHEFYNIPQGEVADIINGNIPVDDMDEFILFAIVKTMNSNMPPSLFTPLEIKTFDRKKYEKDVLKFPIKIKCIQVNRDQWIGAIDTNFLIRLRNNQMINYNINAQRTMKTVRRGNEIEYKISLNKKAVREITDAFVTDNYIPDTITLNIVDEAEPDFYYDEESCELVINSIKYFDIPDGYHRYIAIGIAKEKEKHFNYPMELRIVNFTEDKAKQFIFQQDQKTKMKKADSNSMNMNAPENIIAERLNNDSKFYLQKEITRNEGKVNLALFASCIRYYFLKDENVSRISNVNRNKLIIQTTNKLRDGINNMLDTCPWMLDINKFDLLEMMMICCVIKYDISYEDNKMYEWFNKLKTDGLKEKYKYRPSATHALHTTIKGVILDMPALY